ncbi:MAG: divergent polysaccharide deacetylase family protein [Rhodospirillales bacterium]|nr:divergent polysaccharide deacetylase family protein [Rhodospirillales bacterium]
MPKLPKLPKLPKFSKLSKLPGLSKLLKRKGGEDDDIDDDDDSEDEFDEKSDAGSKSDSAKDSGKDSGKGKGGDDDDDADEYDDDDYDDDEEEEGSFGRKKQLLVAAVGAAVLLVGILGGAGWWYFSDDGGGAQKTAVRTQSQHRDPAKGQSVQLALPPKPGSKKAMLTPPSGSKARRPARRDSAKPSRSTQAGSKEGFGRVIGDIGGRFGGKANPLGGSLNALGGAPKEGSGIVIPSVTSVTIQSLPDYPAGRPLGPTPDARLIEKKEGLPGPLPRIGEDDTKPWQAYARPYTSKEPGMRVAIAIIGLGLSRAATMASISKLPPEITLVLDPYATDLSDWLVRARLVGHEVMVALPMESERFPIQDAGPFSLDTGLSLEDNLKRLELVLSQFSGYTGVATVLGSRFGTSVELLTPVLDHLKKRGLLFLATGAQADLLAPKIAAKIGLPRAISDLTLDENPSRGAIEANLIRLEGIIRDKKSAVAIARPYPSTIARLIAWTKTLDGKKIELVPLSALADTSIAEKP